MTMLEIKNLHARVEDKEILRGINLTVNPGEVHAIMGPNGSGKSTLAGVLSGREAFDVTDGQVLFDGKDLLDMDPEERAREGIFMASISRPESVSSSTASLGSSTAICRTSFRFFSPPEKPSLTGRLSRSSPMWISRSFSLTSFMKLAASISGWPRYLRMALTAARRK